MGRNLNNKETTVIKNTIRRLSKMCDSPTLYVGHTTAIEWAMLMLEDALDDRESKNSNFNVMMRARAAEVALKWEESREWLDLIWRRKKALHEAVEKGEF